MLDDDTYSAGAEPSGSPSADPAPLSLLAPALALGLAACGDGGGSSAPVAAPAPSAPVVVVTPSVTTAQASRFLAQPTMGATRESIDAVVARGFSGWLDDQMAMPRATSHWDWLTANG